MKAASKEAEGSLAQKLEELSLLMESYDALCSRGKRDPRDQMTWVLEQMETGNFAQNHVFYIERFPGLYPAAYGNPGASDCGVAGCNRQSQL